MWGRCEEMCTSRGGSGREPVRKTVRARVRKGVRRGCEGARGRHRCQRSGQRSPAAVCRLQQRLLLLGAVGAHVVPVNQLERADRRQRVAEDEDAPPRRREEQPRRLHRRAKGSVGSARGGEEGGANRLGGARQVRGRSGWGEEAAGRLCTPRRRRAARRAPRRAAAAAPRLGARGGLARAPLDAPESGSGRRLGGEGEADLGQVRYHVLSQPAAARRRAVPVAAAAAAGRVEVERVGEGDEADAGVRGEGGEDGGEGGEHRVDDGRGGGRLRHLEEQEERRRERRAGLVLWRRDELDGAAGELGPTGGGTEAARGLSRRPPRLSPRQRGRRAPFGEVAPEAGLVEVDDLGGRERRDGTAQVAGEGAAAVDEGEERVGVRAAPAAPAAVQGRGQG